MRRPALNEIALEGARSGGVCILIGLEEWDEDIQAAYDAGHVIIEFDATELAIQAFRKTILNLQPGLFTKD